MSELLRATVLYANNYEAQKNKKIFTKDFLESFLELENKILGNYDIDLVNCFEKFSESDLKHFQKIKKYAKIKERKL